MVQIGQVIGKTFPGAQPGTIQDRFGASTRMGFNMLEGSEPSIYGVAVVATLDAANFGVVRKVQAGDAKFIGLACRDYPMQAKDATNYGATIGRPTLVDTYQQLNVLLIGGSTSQPLSGAARAAKGQPAFVRTTADAQQGFVEAADTADTVPWTGAIFGSDALSGNPVTVVLGVPQA